MKPNYYLACLKAKNAECDALQCVDPQHKDTHFSPLLEVDEPPADHLAEKLMTAWGDRHKLYLDTTPLGTKAGRAFAEELFQLGAKIVPVVSYEASREQIEAASTIAALVQRGACLRIDLCLATRPEFAFRIREIIESIGIEPEQTDVVLDAGYLPTCNDSHVAQVMTAMDRLPQLQRWRSLVVMGSAFPKSLAELIDGAGRKFVPRREWHLYELLSERDLPRIPDFGDYGVQHPSRTKAPAFPSGANIRYTTDEGFLILRGLRRQGREYSRKLSQELISLPEFRGSSFSPADEFIEKCAAGIEGVGSAETWRYVGTAHHLQVVITQCAS